MENYSLSDLKAITDGADGISGGSAWLIILFVLIFGGGGFGWNRNAAAEATSTSELLSAKRYESLSNRINQVGDGISSLGYSQLQQMDANTVSINGNITAEGRAIQAQLSNCCCENQRNIDSVRYDMANFAASINSNIDNKFAALEKSQLESRLAEQAQQISQLQLNQALCGIPRVNNTAYGVYPYNSCYSGCGCAN